MLENKIQNEPWLTEEAIDFLSTFLTSTSRVIEFGTGSSTFWFSTRCGDTVRHVDLEFDLTSKHKIRATAAKRVFETQEWCRRNSELVHKYLEQRKEQASKEAWDDILYELDKRRSLENLELNDIPYPEKRD